VFSRNLLDTSEKFPEVPNYVKEACSQTNVTSFVLDTEVVAYNRETKQFVPFQVLSTRKKTEESEENAKVKIIVQAFDLMYLNGRSLLNCSLAERRALLIKNFSAVEGKFQFASALDLKEDGNTILLEEFLENAVKNQCDGLMIKTLNDNATYQPSVRSLNWLKLKKDYLDGMGDSVDLVPLGAYYGRGKRTGVFGAYLLACYDVDSEEFQSVCKLGTGFSDEDLKSLTESFNGHIIPNKSSNYNVSDSLECDVWFDACQVWEIKAADLSKSSTHKGAIDKTGEAGRGIGLRFPRFERVRDDKNPEQATTSDQILEMYYAQDSIVDDGHGNDDDEGI
jgi:DNA ligase-1